MRVWIEVSNEWQWDQKRRRELGLIAPKRARYKNMLIDVKPNDVIAHYLTTARTLTKAKKSSVVGLSIANSNPIEEEYKIVVNLRDVMELKVPIKFTKFSKVRNVSAKLREIISLNMQVYFKAIEKKDMISLLQIHPENWRGVRSNSAYDHLTRVRKRRKLFVK